MSDSKLSVFRYDSQGCIESEEFDIFQYLPLFVTMIAIFQRFSLRTWGLSERDATKVKVDNKSFRLANTPTPFQLTGRRTTGTFAKYDEDALNDTTDPPHTNGDGEPQCEPATEHVNPDDWPDGMPLFLKSSWVECARCPEFHLIAKAHERANTLLPVEYREMVTDHIPTVIAAQECVNDTTARFRLFLKFSGAFPHLNVDYIRNHARVRIWIVMPRLLAIHKLELEPSKFLSVFWDAIRCEPARLKVSHP